MYQTNPEQSNPLGDVPPQTYGVPRYLEAIDTTFQPLFVDGRAAGLATTTGAGAGARTIGAGAGLLWTTARLTPGIVSCWPGWMLDGSLRLFALTMALRLTPNESAISER